MMINIVVLLSRCNGEDLLHARGIDICKETVRLWRHRFGLIFALQISKRLWEGKRFSHWRCHLDEAFVKVNGERHSFWRAVDNEGN